MWEGVARAAPMLPAHKPRYLMGWARRKDLLRCAASGIDLFDCGPSHPRGPERALVHASGRLQIKAPATPRMRGRPIPTAPATPAGRSRALSQAPVRGPGAAPRSG